MKKKYENPIFSFRKIQLPYDILTVSNPEGDGEGGSVQPVDPFGGGALRSPRRQSLSGEDW